MGGAGFRWMLFQNLNRIAALKINGMPGPNKWHVCVCVCVVPQPVARWVQFLSTVTETGLNSHAPTPCTPTLAPAPTITHERFGPPRHLSLRILRALHRQPLSGFRCRCLQRAVCFCILVTKRFICVTIWQEVRNNIEICVERCPKSTYVLAAFLFSRATSTRISQVGDYVRLKDGHEKEYNRHSWREEEDPQVIQCVFFSVSFCSMWLSWVTWRCRWRSTRSTALSETRVTLVGYLSIALALHMHDCEHIFPCFLPIRFALLTHSSQAWSHTWPKTRKETKPQWKASPGSRYAARPALCASKDVICACPVTSGLMARGSAR